VAGALKRLLRTCSILSQAFQSQVRYINQTPLATLEVENAWLYPAPDWIMIPTLFHHIGYFIHRHYPAAGRFPDHIFSDSGAPRVNMLRKKSCNICGIAMLPTTNYVQYGKWVWGIISRGDWGNLLEWQMPVKDLIWERLALTRGAFVVFLIRRLVHRHTPWAYIQPPHQ